MCIRDRYRPVPAHIGLYCPTVTYPAEQAQPIWAGRAQEGPGPARPLKYPLFDHFWAKKGVKNGVKIGVIFEPTLSLKRPKMA